MTNPAPTIACIILAAISLIFAYVFFTNGLRTHGYESLLLLVINLWMSRAYDRSRRQSFASRRPGRRYSPAMAKVIRETRTIEVVHGNWNGPGGSWIETAKTEHVRVELEIDVDGLFRDLGNAAARNRTGKSVEAGGLITARRVR